MADGRKVGYYLARVSIPDLAPNLFGFPLRSFSLLYTLLGVKFLPRAMISLCFSGEFSCAKTDYLPTSPLWCVVLLETNLSPPNRKRAKRCGKEYRSVDEKQTGIAQRTTNCKLQPTGSLEAGIRSDLVIYQLIYLPLGILIDFEWYWPLAMEKQRFGTSTVTNVCMCVCASGSKAEIWRI